MDQIFILCYLIASWTFRWTNGNDRNRHGRTPPLLFPYFSFLVLLCIMAVPHELQTGHVATDVDGKAEGVKHGGLDTERTERRRLVVSIGNLGVVRLSGRQEWKNFFFGGGG